MSKYLLDKFLFTVDRDPELTERYREDPAGTVAWWEAEMANTLLNCIPAEKTTWLAFSDEERRALPTLARGAAMRFLATRAYDWLHTPADALVTRKDPMDFARRLSFYAEAGDRAFPG